MSKTSTDYTSIRVSTLRGDLKIPFDVYVFVAGKYIHYCRNGTSFEGVRLERLKAKKLKKMFIRPDEEGAYRQYLEESIDNAYKNPGGKAIELRAEVIQGFQQAAAEDFLENPLDEFSYKNLRSSAQRFTEFLQSEPESVRAILALKNLDQSITHHGVAVAALAIAIAQDRNLREGLPLHLLALGCMIHDVEHYFTTLDIFRPVKEFSAEDLSTYKKHPIAGAHRLQGTTFVDELVNNIISQHEEHMDGSGFPKGLYEKDMDPLVMVAATANAYDRLVGFADLKPKDALKTLLIDKMGAYPLANFQSLQSILKKQNLV